MQSRAENLLYAGCSLAIGIFIFWWASVLPHLDVAYSSDVTYVMQNEAFLRGRLSYSPSLFSLKHDVAWHNAAQQVSGLGVPLLRLPFDLVARCFGKISFPDRYSFFIWLVLCTWAWIRGLALVIRKILPQLSTHASSGLAVLWGGLWILNPAFTYLIRSGLGTHEEPILYAFLWSLLVLSLLCSTLIEKKGQTFFVLCLAAGFLPWIRVTFMPCSGLCFLAGSWSFRKSLWRLILGTVLFVVGVGGLAVTNMIRFGSPVEFGHTLTMVWPQLIYATRFDGPVHWFPWYKRYREFFEILFFLKRVPEGYLPAYLLPTYRLRDFQFKPFDGYLLFALLVSWGVLVRKGKWILLASVISLGTLFFFYESYNGLSSRYFIEYVPGIWAALLLASLLVGKRGVWVGTAFVLAWTVATSRGRMNESKMNPIMNISHTEALTSLKEIIGKEEKYPADQTAIPARYACTKWNPNLIQAGMELWDIADSCHINMTTFHFFRSPSCVRLHIEFPQAKSAQGDFFDDREIQVKKKGESWVRRAEWSRPNGKMVEFCGRGVLQKSRKKPGPIELVTIAWVDARKHSSHIWDTSWWRAYGPKLLEVEATS